MYEVVCSFPDNFTINILAMEKRTRKKLFVS